MKLLTETPLLIGLAGTLNAGKDSFAHRLEEEHGFLHMSTSDMIRQMKRDEFGADNPESLLKRNDPFINELRSTRNPGFLIEEIHAKWLKEQEQYPGGFVASAMRAVGEAEEIQRIGGIIVFVDADPKTRYERSQLRQRDANETGVSFEQFMATEQSEIDVDPNDKSVQNLGAMREMADIVIMNDGNDIAAFQDEAVEKLTSFLAS